MSPKVLLPLLLAIPFAANAKDGDSPQPAAWSGTGELGLALARGNARSESVNGKVVLGKQDEHWKYDLHASMLRSRGEVTGDFDGDGVPESRYKLSANRYELGASTAYRFDPRNHLVATARYENDDFLSYAHQTIVSLGYGHTFADSERTTLETEAGPGLRRARVAESGEIERSAVARARLGFKQQLTDNSALYDNLLVEAGTDNTFLQNDLGVSVAMNSRIALKAGLQARRNSSIEAGAKNTDTLTTVNVVYKIR
jgi:putative salt-induced outer membrane protein